MVFEPASLTPEERIAKLERQLERERAARKEAEEIAEKGLRDLYIGREWLALLQRITEGANRTDDLASAMEVTLREVCEKMGWVFGNAYDVEDSSGRASKLIESGAFEKLGISAIGIGGHPEGHPNMDAQECFDVLRAKRDAIESRGMAPLIVTQFSFDADRVLEWLIELRRCGIDAPVRLGVPGPAGIKTLLRFAKRCGVGASASVMSKYGISMSRLMSSAGPDRLVERLSQGLGPEHGPVRLHFYPFGGVARTVEWINDYAARNSRSGEDIGE
ncbi:methylenetetrahydrofolate reductase [Qipengyuania sp. MTN3-11]|uniref:methylenetetrahydrofolate reductase n=1 Tax=Qipengyuania sp. MTN3-11 TaxID=3056557 RepID=UPI0036F301C1